jgi:hypothetical protein
LLSVTLEGMVLDPPEPLRGGASWMVRVWVARDPIGIGGASLWVVAEAEDIAAQLAVLAPGDRIGLLGRMVLDQRRPGHIEVIAGTVFSHSKLGALPAGIDP